MKKLVLPFVAALGLAAGSSQGRESEVPPSGFGRLDHVFLIVMENETDTDILGNPNAPFINAYAKIANQASNFFAVGHPSAPNYLELVGGSNFGLSNDYLPAWTDKGCVDNQPNGTGCGNALPPIIATGTDNAVVATAMNEHQCNGEVTVQGAAVPNNCALYDYPATSFSPKSIADQLVAKHRSWKTYQESLPMLAEGPVGVNYSDGSWSNLSASAVFAPGPIQKLYAVKHNPFAYFGNIQLGKQNALSFKRVSDFDGPTGLWANLQSGMPSFSFIVPNQCHDMHGFVKGGPPICESANSTTAGLLMAEGDATVKKLVLGIKASPTWKRGRNVIVLIWDENDYSNAANRIVMLSETNYGENGKVSARPYDHFSLLKTFEAGFGLPCLNHACDVTSKVMNDVFGGSE